MAIKTLFCDHNGNPAYNVVVNGILYRWNKTWKTYNSVVNNELLTQRDLGISIAVEGVNTSSASRDDLV